MVAETTGKETDIDPSQKKEIDIDHCPAKWCNAGIVACKLRSNMVLSHIMLKLIC
jgi:hypothetical protein